LEVSIKSQYSIQRLKTPVDLKFINWGTSKNYDWDCL
jgi:hypothetical protein